MFEFETAKLKWLAFNSNPSCQTKEKKRKNEQGNKWFFLLVQQPELLKLKEEMSRINSKIKRNKKELDKRKEERRKHASDIKELQKGIKDLEAKQKDLQDKGCNSGEKIEFDKEKLDRYFQM